LIEKPQHPEIGRELKATELKPPQIVWVHKMGGQFGNTCATMWAVEVLEHCVVFYAGEPKIALLAKRIGPDLTGITDDSNATMRIYEYLGKP